jgi:hypothetical protein
MNTFAPLQFRFFVVIMVIANIFKTITTLDTFILNLSSQNPSFCSTMMKLLVTASAKISAFHHLSSFNWTPVESKQTISLRNIYSNEIIHKNLSSI